MILRLAPHLVGDLEAVEPVPFGKPFEPASRGWITQERSAPGHIGDPRAGHRREGRDPLPPLLRRRRHVPRAGDRLGWTVLGWLRRNPSDRRRWIAGGGSRRLAADLGHLRPDAAGDHAQLHGSPDARPAGDRDPRRAGAQQRGLRLARDGLRPGLRRRRHRHGHASPTGSASAGSTRPSSWAGRPSASLTGWVTSYRELLLCRVLLGFFEAGQWPCALAASQRLLPRQHRPLGNSILQSGASLGAIATPQVILLLNRGGPSGWRLPFRVIGAAGLVWVVAWLTAIRPRDLEIAAGPTLAGARRIAAPAAGSGRRSGRDRGRAGRILHPPVPGPGRGRDHHQPLLAVLPGLDADDAREAVRLHARSRPRTSPRSTTWSRGSAVSGGVPGQVAGRRGLAGAPGADGDVPVLRACSPR